MRRATGGGTRLRGRVRGIRFGGRGKECGRAESVTAGGVVRRAKEECAVDRPAIMTANPAAAVGGAVTVGARPLMRPTV